ncbi:MAG: hypothetical protein EXS31_08465 [Pedosphaera sp.]|nr:hypothetical protein [Pedosphaera sp.]
MKLQIPDTGCAKCHALTTAMEQAAQALGLPYELEKVTDLNRIMSFGVMRTPTLFVDGKGQMRGEVPSVVELKALLQPPDDSLRKLRSSIPPQADLRGIATEVEVVEHRDVAKAICQEAERFSANLISIGSHGRSWLVQSDSGLGCPRRDEVQQTSTFGRVPT